MSKQACRNCPELEAQGFYDDRELFWKHESLLSNAKERGRLRIRKKPSWYEEPETRDQVAAGEAYYQCRTCRAVWHVLLPERAFAGYIRRIR